MEKLKDENSHGVCDVDTALFHQVRQMWLSRGACIKMMNRQQAVNATVRAFQRADKDFDNAMREWKASAKLEHGVTAGFDYLSGAKTIV